jgi:hypothetical protein
VCRVGKHGDSIDRIMMAWLDAVLRPSNAGVQGRDWACNNGIPGWERVHPECFCCSFCFCFDVLADGTLQLPVLEPCVCPTLLAGWLAGVTAFREVGQGKVSCKLVETEAAILA